MLVAFWIFPPSWGTAFKLSHLNADADSIQMAKFEVYIYSLPVICLSIKQSKKDTEKIIDDCFQWNNLTKLNLILNFFNQCKAVFVLDASLLSPTLNGTIALSLRTHNLMTIFTMPLCVTKKHSALSVGFLLVFWWVWLCWVSWHPINYFSDKNFTRLISLPPTPSAVSDQIRSITFWRPFWRPFLARFFGALFLARFVGRAFLARFFSAHFGALFEGSL